jgi:hypothetical protein
MADGQSKFFHIQSGHFPPLNVSKDMLLNTIMRAPISDGRDFVHKTIQNSLMTPNLPSSLILVTNK